MEEPSMKPDVVSDSKEDGMDMREEAQLEKYMYMKKIVFIVMVSWSRWVGETRTLKDVYTQSKLRLPEGTGLYLGCNEELRAGRGLRYHAVVLLRGKLATIGDLKEWLDLGEKYSVREPRTGVKLEKFLQDTQDYCGREGSEVCSSRIVVQRGDEETQVMLERQSDWKRYMSSKVQELTEKMRRHQKSDREKHRCSVINELNQGALGCRNLGVDML
jgi:hypothetical protein